MIKQAPKDRAVRAILAKRGLPVRIARLCKVSRQAIDYWTRVPEPHIAIVARELKWKVWEVRPDLYRPRK